jgi:hypothetical protein
MSTLCTALALLAALPAQASDATSNRWLIETDLVLPQVITLTADRNTTIRAHTLQTKLVMACSAGEPQRQGHELACTIDDVALGGVTFKAERGRMQRVLEEMDHKLTGAAVRIHFTDDGRVRALGLDLNSAQPEINRRVNRMGELQRLVLMRAMAGLELQRPETIGDEPWVQTRTVAFDLPALRGSWGGAQLVHRASPLADGGQVVQTIGRGSAVPSSDTVLPNLYTGTHESVAVLEGDLVVERKWSTITRPTPSSLVAQGFTGLPYVQRGSLRKLGDDEQVDLGPTHEWVPGPKGPTTLQRATTHFQFTDPHRTLLLTEIHQGAGWTQSTDLYDRAPPL